MRISIRKLRALIKEEIHKLSTLLEYVLSPEIDPEIGFTKKKTLVKPVPKEISPVQQLSNIFAQFESEQGDPRRKKKMGLTSTPNVHHFLLVQDKRRQDVVDQLFQREDVQELIKMCKKEGIKIEYDGCTVSITYPANYVDSGSHEINLSRLRKKYRK